MEIGIADNPALGEHRIAEREWITVATAGKEAVLVGFARQASADRMARFSSDPDWAIRARAFAAVERLSVEGGGRIPWAEINKGFEYEGERIEFASKAGGIFKPRQMSAALSIKTTVPRAGRPTWYRDQGAGIDIKTGLLPYDLVRDPKHWTNRALRQAYEWRVPLIYFRAVESASYEAIWPVWIEDFQDEARRVLLAAADTERREVSSVEASEGMEPAMFRERSYTSRITRHRNHQAWFSSRTRSAYGYRCAFSGLALGKLLVGAHIKSDEDGGPASVSNGICMSTLHHAAFDAHLIGVDPELRIHVSRTVILADDGPLLASLQGLDGGSLRVPEDPLDHPDPVYLDWKYSRFEAAET